MVKATCVGYPSSEEFTLKLINFDTVMIQAYLGKNFDELLKIYEQLSPKGRTSCRKQLTALGLTNFVKFLAPVQPADIKSCEIKNKKAILGFENGEQWQIPVENAVAVPEIAAVVIKTLMK